MLHGHVGQVLVKAQRPVAGFAGEGVALLLGAGNKPAGETPRLRDCPPHRCQLGQSCLPTAPEGGHLGMATASWQVHRYASNKTGPAHIDGGNEVARTPERLHVALETPGQSGLAESKCKRSTDTTKAYWLFSSIVKRIFSTPVFTHFHVAAIPQPKSSNTASLTSQPINELTSFFLPLVPLNGFSNAPSTAHPSRKASRARLAALEVGRGRLLGRQGHLGTQKTCRSCLSAGPYPSGPAPGLKREG